MERAAAVMPWLVRALVATALLAMMVIPCLDVVGRYLINRPLPGAAELVQYLLIATVFISLPLVTLRHEHISISLIDAVLGSGTRRVRLKISLSGDRRRRLLLCKVQGSAFCGLSVPVACRFNMHE